MNIIQLISRKVFKQYFQENIKFGTPVDSAVLTFIGYKQTNEQRNRQAKYL